MSSCEKNANRQSPILSSYRSPQFKDTESLYINLYLHPPQIYQLRTHNMSRVLHRYRRGHGFESRSRLIFFQALISQLLLKLCV